MGLIPQEIIARVLDRADIVEVVSGYIPLKPAGRNFKAPCPFHHEKTPSFIVNPDKQIFHCFGCGAGGNAVTFVMKQERMEFPEAIRFLAEKSGITIPDTQGQANPLNDAKKDIIRVNELAAKYYQQNLLTDKSDSARSAREYLKARGLELDDVKRFGIGLALSGWDGLLKFLVSQHFSPAFLEKAGLVLSKSQGGGTYDRFRERIIFPIYNARSEVVAFGGRTLDADNPAKYINSPETPLYTKGAHLYGLNWAKDAIGRLDCVVVVEGYMDFVTPFSAGVHHVVASLGTALTPEQIRLARRYTKNVVMLYDADPSGQTAMVRSLDLLVEEGMSVKVAVLPDGEDPDSFVRKSGAQGLLTAVGEASPLFDFKLAFLKSRFSEGSIESNAKIAGEMLRTIAKFENAIIQDEYLKKLSRALMVAPEALGREFSKIKDSRPRAVSAQVTQKPASSAIRPVERSLLRLMLEERELIALGKRDIVLEDLKNRHVRDIIAKIFEMFDNGQEPTASALMNHFTEQEALDMITGTVAGEETLLGDRQKMYRDCANRLRQENRKARRQEILTQMEIARAQNDEKSLEELTHVFNQLIKES